MILEIGNNQGKVRVEVERTSGRSIVRVEGREVACDWVRLPDGQCSLIVDGRVFDLDVEVIGDRCRINGRGERLELGISDPRRRQASGPVGESLSGTQRICAEMPGKVIRVFVKRGDAVVVDQGLLVLEAMKMQNEIRAPRSGTVQEVAAVDGRAVSTGEFLLEIGE
jgi:acetyl/propionyl-CoA carboxylase alpha subunit